MANNSGTARSKKKTTKTTPKRTQTEKQAEEKRQKIVMLVGALLLIAAIVAITVLSLFATGVLGKKGEEGNATFVVSVDNSTYKKDGGGLVVFSGGEIRLTSLREDDAEYEVKILANGDANFMLMIGEEDWQWRWLAGRDLSRGFDITKTANGFTVKFESVEDIVSKAMYLPVEIPDKLTVQEDLFTLVISDGQTDLKLGFRPGVYVEGVEITPPNLQI